MENDFYVLSERDISDINGGGWIAGVAVGAVGAVLTVAAVVGVAPAVAATAAVSVTTAKVLIGVGGAISTATSTISAWLD